MVDEIIKTLSNKDKVTQFLKQNEISDIDTINDIQQYEREGGRKGLILKVKETNNSGLIKIMIDIRSGQPSTDQVNPEIQPVRNVSLNLKSTTG